MQNRKIRLILILILIFLAVIILVVVWQGIKPRKPANIQPGDYSYAIEYSEYRLRKLMEDKHLPSIAFTLIDDQETVWQGAFGMANREAEIPAEVDTVYKLWSVSKVFTAIETMRLVEDGLLDLDASITEYIPSFSIQSRFQDPGTITARSILTHRSGLPRNGCFFVDFGKDALKDMVASLEKCQMATPVGYRYKYSNIGIDTLGYLIQDNRDDTFPSYMFNNLLQPIGMTDSTFLRENIPSQREIAMGYEYYQGEYYPYEQNDITGSPSGNLYSTIEDMGKFVKFIFRGGAVNGEQIIGTDILNSMFVDQTSNPKDPQMMGLGWKTSNALIGEHLVWHDGGPSEGIGSLVAFLPDRKLGIVLFANGTSFDGSVSVPLALDILKIMLESKFDLTVPDSMEPAIVKMDPANLEKYAGRYIAFGEVLEVLVNKDRLRGRLGGFTFNLEPLGNDEFQPQHWLSDIGLASVLGSPIDLRQLKIKFLDGDEIAGDFMIIDVGGISHEICPRYPNLESLSFQWKKFIGEFDLVYRLPSGELDNKILGTSTIWVEDDILQMGGVVGPIIPISATEIIIASGPYAGDIMILDPETENISHQSIVFVRH